MIIPETVRLFANTLEIYAIVLFVFALMLGMDDLLNDIWGDEDV